MSNTFPVLSVSVHHALGGRALWLVVLGHRNGPEAQSLTSIAGHRLNRVLGGFSGHFSLDDHWYSYFLRLNEIVIVATYPSGVDGCDAMAAAGAARSALLEICGGKQADVSIVTLSRSGAEVQLALRRAVSGYGRIFGIGTPKFDASSVQLSPEAPPEDATSVAQRASNDVTSLSSAPSNNDAWQLACNKGNSLGESLSRALRPSQASLACLRETWAAGPHLASQSSIHSYLSLKCAPERPRSHANSESKHSSGDAGAARLNLLPRAMLTALEAANGRGFFSGGMVGNRDGEAAVMWEPASGFLRMNGGGFDGGMGSGGQLSSPGASVHTPSCGGGGGGGQFYSLPLSQVLAPPPAPLFTITIRLAAQCMETATLSESGGWGIGGVATLRAMYGNALPPEMEESGHGPLKFLLQLASPHAPLASLSYRPPSDLAGGRAPGGVGGLVAAVPAEEIIIPSSTSDSGGGGGGGFAADGIFISLTLPSRSPGVSQYLPVDVGQICYRFAHGYTPPPLLTLSASAKTTWTQTSSPPPASTTTTWIPKHMDVLVKSCLDPSRSDLSPSLVHFLVSLPSPPIPQASFSPAPVCSPLAQWSSPRSQLLWSLSGVEECAPPSNGKNCVATTDNVMVAAATANSSTTATVCTHFSPGKSVLFRARAPLLCDTRPTAQQVATPSSDPSSTAPPTPLPVQARFTFTSGTVAPFQLKIPPPPSSAAVGKGGGGGVQQQPLNHDLERSGMDLKVEILGLLVKYSSQVRAVYK